MTASPRTRRPARRTPPNEGIPVGSPADQVAQALRPLGYRVFAQTYRGDYGIVIEGPPAHVAGDMDAEGRVGNFTGTGLHADDDITARTGADIIRILTARAPATDRIAARIEATAGPVVAEEVTG